MTAETAIPERPSLGPIAAVTFFLIALCGSLSWHWFGLRPAILTFLAGSLGFVCGCQVMWWAKPWEQYENGSTEQAR